MIGYYFGFPHGQIWPNLLASAVCAAIVWWRLHRQAVIHHVRQAAQAAKHHAERLDQAGQHHSEMKRLLASHCTDLKDHVTAAAAPVPDSAPFAGMSDEEFEARLRKLMRANPRVLETFIRQQARRQGKPLAGGDRF